MQTATTSSSSSVIRRVSPSGKIIRERPGSGNLLKVFGISACGLAAYLLFLVFTRSQSVGGAVGAVIVIALAMVPSFLWTIGRVGGLPLFPIYALTFIWSFGLPLLNNHPVISQFTPAEQFLAALTVAGFLLLGGAIWYLIAQLPVRQPRHCLALNRAGADRLFFVAICFGLVFTVASTANWLPLSEGISPIARAVALALQALGCFVLSYRMGAGRLSSTMRIGFLCLLLVLLLSTLPGLLLINAMSIIGVVGLGYTLSSERFPWLISLFAALLFGFLHGGKAEMRARHWGEDNAASIRPWEYPGFVAEWFTTSAGHLFKTDNSAGEGQSLLERASLMQLLLYVERASPKSVPFLRGETYAVIPEMFIPRVFYPDKPRSHEGTYLLNIHYGFQTREDTDTTTIGFGLVNEAYANFGPVGIAMLAVVIGGFYGAVTRLTRQVPVLSFRALFAVIVLSYSFQAEFSAAVYVAAVFQSTVALLVFAALFMRTRPVEPKLETLLR